MFIRWSPFLRRDTETVSDEYDDGNDGDGIIQGSVTGCDFGSPPRLASSAVFAGGAGRNCDRNSRSDRLRVENGLCVKYLYSEFLRKPGSGRNEEDRIPDPCSGSLDGDRQTVTTNSAVVLWDGRPHPHLTFLPLRWCRSLRTSPSFRKTSTRLFVVVFILLIDPHSILFIFFYTRTFTPCINPILNPHRGGTDSDTCTSQSRP